MTKPSSLDIELDELLSDFLEGITVANDEPDMKTRFAEWQAVIDDTTKQIQSLISLKVIEGKKSELERIICHKHGFGTQSCPQIKDRLKELNQLALGDSTSVIS